MSAWPYLSESWCPFCDRDLTPPRLLRVHDNGAEFECPFCGERHTRREGDEAAYAFFPGDIYRALVDGEPVKLGGFQA